MLLGYFTLIFQLIIVMPYLVKLKGFMVLNFNYLLIFISGLALHYFIFFIFLHIKKIGKYLVLFFSTVPYLIYEISLFIFGYKMDRAIVASALENEAEMITFFFNFKIILVSVIFVIIIIILINKIKINKKIDKICFSISTFVVILNILFVAITKNRVYLVSFPVVDCFDLLKIGKTLKGLKSQEQTTVYEKKLDEIKRHFQLGKEKTGINIVLVIGESARSDFFNRYASVLKEENVINFKKSKSSYFYTRDAVPEILTLNKNEKNFSLVNIMNSINFNTFWVGAQSIRGNTDSPYAHFALDSKVHIYKENNRNIQYDFELLDYIDKIIDGKGNNFYIIHQIGSHTPFFKRFESKYAKYEDYCRSKDMLLCSRNKINNAYANTMVYTDAFLKEIITRFKDKNTILLFTADHATDEVYLNKEENRLIVPAFVWLNGEFVKYKSVIKNNFTEKSTFSHKKIIESLLDCAEVKSDMIDKKNSICRVEYE